MKRRRVLACALAWPGLGGCTSVPVVHAWESRLRGDTVALLGEVHDNAEHHRQRAAVMRRAVEAGWRPALVMEQFDIDRQQHIDSSRRERPQDAAHLIAQSATPRAGWNWDAYRPLVELALQHELPLVAGNLPRAQAMRLVREGTDAVLGAARAEALGLNRAPDSEWQAAQEREIDAGHCGTLPRALWGGMVRAQAARDAVMAQLLQQHATRGAVLLAGNGHVRRDIGVPRWLDASTASRRWSVGFLERGGDTPAAASFDAVVVTAAATRDDPCAALRERRPAAAP
ncbi:ChaN family lipoprotein [Piscinibacter sp. XHJ-5]|uniref:ChaN family lipoprotein n=1 Tax=Piscinibacter sp. XHJ-5 TaxID=3037797 RepID=UPI0024530D2C|nr:ChaN family lipoprotein [Piscinibacter sp. XHJ-5]